MCFPGSATWKREVVPDHKFDFVDVQDYHNEKFGTRFAYAWIYILLFKSFAVYLSDLFTAITMLSTNDYSNGIFTACQNRKLDNCIVVPFDIGKWIFVGCIIASYLLLVYEAWKAKKIIRSRDISYAFTNVMANDYYSFRSYDHFCFFSEIENTSQKKDDVAFFIFFTFKGWKRLLLADGPRQVINVLTLYALWLVNNQNIAEVENYVATQTSTITKFLLASVAFTVIIFAGSFLLLVIAGIAYVPLLCYIQGNLKEYCCHRVDKRISELMAKKTRQRVREQARLAQREAKGDFSHLRGKKGGLGAGSILQQASLPQIALDDDLPSLPRTKGSVKADGADSKYAASFVSEGVSVPAYGAYPDFPPSLNGAAPDYPPPMPMYEQGAFGHAPPQMGFEYDDNSSQYEANYDPYGARDYIGATSSTHLNGSEVNLGTLDHGHDRFAQPQQSQHATFHQMSYELPQANRDEMYAHENGERIGTSSYLDYYGGEDQSHDPDSYPSSSLSPSHETQAHRRSRSGAGRSASAM